MRTMTKTLLQLSTLGVLVLARALHAAEDLKVAFDDKGLASIVHNGVDLLKPEDPRFRLLQVCFVDAQAKSGARQA